MARVPSRRSGGQVRGSGTAGSDPYHEAGEHELALAEFGTPYVLLGARTLVDSNDPGDVQAGVWARLARHCVAECRLNLRSGCGDRS